MKTGVAKPAMERAGWRSSPLGRWLMSDNADRQEGSQPVDAFSDEALVRVIVSQGNRQHADALLARYREKVFHIVLSVVGPGHQEEAQDLAQEVCIRMLQKLGQFREDSQFSTWLYRMTFNASMDYLRKASRKSHQLGQLSAQPSTESVKQPATELAAEQSASALRLAVSALPDTHRIVTQMHYWLGLPVAEIAELLGTNANTVKSHLRRARLKLGQILEEN